LPPAVVRSGSGHLCACRGFSETSRKPLACCEDLGYIVRMTKEPEVPVKETDRSVSRRAIAKKIAYVAPTVLAVIAASERPALAQSSLQ